MAAYNNDAKNAKRLIPGKYRGMVTKTINLLPQSYVFDEEGQLKNDKIYKWVRGLFVYDSFNHSLKDKEAEAIYKVVSEIHVTRRLEAIRTAYYYFENNPLKLSENRAHILNVIGVACMDSHKERYPTSYATETRLRLGSYESTRLRETKIHSLLKQMDTSLATQIVNHLERNISKPKSSFNAVGLEKMPIYGDKKFGVLDYKIDFLRIVKLLPGNFNDGIARAIQTLLIGYQTDSMSANYMIEYLGSVPKRNRTEVIIELSKAFKPDSTKAYDRTYNSENKLPGKHRMMVTQTMKLLPQEDVFKTGGGLSYPEIFKVVRKLFAYNVRYHPEEYTNDRLNKVYYAIEGIENSRRIRAIKAADDFFKDVKDPTIEDRCSIIEFMDKLDDESINYLINIWPNQFVQSGPYNIPIRPSFDIAEILSKSTVEQRKLFIGLLSKLEKVNPAMSSWHRQQV